MKKIFKTLLVLVFGFAMFSLTACDTSIPEIRDVKAVAIREKVTVDFTIWDEDDLLTELVLTITGIVDDEDYESSSRVTISGGSYATEEDAAASDGTVEEEDFIGEAETVEFTNLTVGETYTVTFNGTYNDKVKKMHTISNLTTSGEGGTKEDAHEISSVDQFEDIVRNDPDGFFELTNDIDFEGKELTPLFSSSKQFVGDFDGKGFAIKNFKQDTYDQYLGVFGYIGSNGNVYDMDVTDVSINSLRYTNVFIGSVAGRNSGTITNVSVENVVVTTSGPDDGDQLIGGLVGINKGGKIYSSSIFNVTLDLNVPGNVRIGGFVGSSEMDNAKEAVIDTCTATDVVLDIQISNTPGYTSFDENVEIYMNVGGFIGYNNGYIVNSSVSNAGTSIYVDNTQTDADINSEDEIEVQEEQRHALINSMDLVFGGFAGTNLSARIESCSADTTLTVEVAYLDKITIGGFVGINSFLSVVTDVKYEDQSYSIIVGEDTKLSSESSTSTIGNSFGIDNAYQTSTFLSGGKGVVNYTAKVRSDVKGDDGLYTYTFDTITIVKNAL